MSITITEGSFEFTVPEKISFKNIAYNKLSLFIGANGTGKSFMFINLWISNFVINALINAKALNMPIDLNEMTQFAFDKCFDNQNFTGKYEVIYSNGLFSTIELIDGKVVDCDIQNIPDDLEHFPQMTYMSKNIRTFDAIKLYLKLRKRIYPNPGRLPEQALAELVQDYKLFDVTYIEKLLGACPMIFNHDLSNFDFTHEETPVNIDFDFNSSELVAVLGNGTVKPLTSYGAGHQSIINMIIGSSL